jgi:hypothetical protein
MPIDTFAHLGILVHYAAERRGIYLMRLKDDFIIRLKTTRVSQGACIINTAKECQVFVINRHDFELLETHANLNYTIINQGKCYDNGKRSIKHIY